MKKRLTPLFKTVTRKPDGSIEPAPQIALSALLFTTNILTTMKALGDADLSRCNPEMGKIFITAGGGALGGITTIASLLIAKKIFNEASRKAAQSPVTLSTMTKPLIAAASLIAITGGSTWVGAQLGHTTAEKFFPRKAPTTTPTTPTTENHDQIPPPTRTPYELTYL